MKKIKIAVNFFGHLRTYQQCMSYMRKNIFDNYSCDFFIHTWSETDSNTKSWHGQVGKKNTVIVDSLRMELSKMLGKEITGIKVETQTEKNSDEFTTFNGHRASVFGMQALLHSMKESDLLREDYIHNSGVQYDYVLFIRPDILIKSDFEINDFLRKLSQSEIDEGFFTLAIPLFPVVSGFKNLGMTDLLFFARPSVISKVMINLDSIIERFKPHAVLKYGAEYELIKHVQASGFTTYAINFCYRKDFEILRAQGAQSLRRRLIRVRIKNKVFGIYIISYITSQIMRVKLKIFSFCFDLCIGNPNESI